MRYFIISCLLHDPTSSNPDWIPADTYMALDQGYPNRNQLKTHLARSKRESVQIVNIIELNNEQDYWDYIK